MLTIHSKFFVTSFSIPFSEFIVLLLAASDPKNMTITWRWVCEDSCMPSSHRVLTVAIPCWLGRQEPSLTGYNVCWMPQPVSSVILGSSTEAWHICSTPSCTGSMFRSESSISSEWQFTCVSKARLPGTSWTAATPHRTLPVVSDFDLPAATILSYHDIVAARSAVGRSPSPVRWPDALPDDLRDPTISGRS